MAQLVKNLLAMQETWVQSLRWEDPLEKGMTTLLQYSCLGNPTDRGAWQTTVHGVAKSRIKFSDETTTGSLQKEFFVLLGKQYKDFPTICYRKQYLRITGNGQCKREQRGIPCPYFSPG